MAHVRKFNEIREDKLDLKAGRQIFDRVQTRDDKNRWATIPKDTENPIDIRIRRLVLSSLDGRIDLVREFINKWVCLGKNHKLYVGRIKDIYLATRDIRIRCRNGEDIIASLDSVIELSETEP